MNSTCEPAIMDTINSVSNTMSLIASVVTIVTCTAQLVLMYVRVRLRGGDSECLNGTHIRIAQAEQE